MGTNSIKQSQMEQAVNEAVHGRLAASASTSLGGGNQTPNMDGSTYRVTAIRPLSWINRENAVFEGFHSLDAAQKHAAALAGPPHSWDLVTVVRVHADGRQQKIATWFEGDLLPCAGAV